MAKPAHRSYSRYSLDAAVMLGQLIRLGRIERGLTAEELATRVGVSRGLVQRIERGDPGCAIGAVLEAAAIAGVELFDTEPSRLSFAIEANREKLTLLPKSVHAPRAGVKDDF